MTLCADESLLPERPLWGLCGEWDESHSRKKRTYFEKLNSAILIVPSLNFRISRRHVLAQDLSVFQT